MAPNLKKTIDKQLAASMKAVAAERDRLDDLIQNAEQLKQNCEDAYDNLKHARDALSELV